MPSGKKISWEVYDHLIVTYLPTMTIEKFTKTHLPEISTKAVSARARKLGIKPAAYRPSDEHKQKIADTITKLTDEDIDVIRQLRDSHSIKQIATALKVGKFTVNRAIHKHKIVLSDTGKKRARETSRLASIGKRPWNKDSVLSEETKAKISKAVSGEKNGQFGRGMTEQEKMKWRESYFTVGVYRMREWLLSQDGQDALARAAQKTTTQAFRQSCSDRMSLAILEGRASGAHRGISTRLETVKGGEFTTKSSYETRFVEMLEADESVVSFVYEPFRIRYWFEGTQLWYIPDFLVVYRDREELIEVKPKRMVGFAKNVAKFEAGIGFHVGFRIITEDDLMNKSNKTWSPQGGLKVG